MDRGERRRRDEVYVKWVQKEIREGKRWGYSRDLRLKRNLGARKTKINMCPCTKKRFGRPKIANGGCKSHGHVPRSRWRRELEREDL